MTKDFIRDPLNRSTDADSALSMPVNMERKTAELDIPSDAAERVRLAEQERRRPEYERRLLMTIGGVLRARLREEVFDPTGNNKTDYEALCDAMRPFDPLPGETNEGGN